MDSNLTRLIWNSSIKIHIIIKNKSSFNINVITNSLLKPPTNPNEFHCLPNNHFHKLNVISNQSCIAWSKIVTISTNLTDHLTNRAWFGQKDDCVYTRILFVNVLKESLWFVARLWLKKNSTSCGMIISSCIWLLHL